MGMAAAQSDRQQQPHEEQEEGPSTAAQHMQQRQDVRPMSRGVRGGIVARKSDTVSSDDVMEAAYLCCRAAGTVQGSQR
ncbi:TPA: hypothetical protein ACH3X2_012972 [Trebouxia sp. C0005]